MRCFKTFPGKQLVHKGRHQTLQSQIKWYHYDDAWAACGKDNYYTRLMAYFFRATWVNRHQKSKRAWIKWGKRWWGFGMQWHPLDHMQTICTSFQTDNHTNSMFTGQMLFLMLNQQCQSTTNYNLGNVWKHIYLRLSNRSALLLLIFLRYTNIPRYLQDDCDNWSLQQILPPQSEAVGNGITQLVQICTN